MNNVWCIRAEYGKYTKKFVEGGYAAIGWLTSTDLSHTHDRNELFPLYLEAHPEDTSKLVIGQQVGQISRFLHEIQAGDYVITPGEDTELLYYGQVAPDPSYEFFMGEDGCPFAQRRKVKWAKEPLRRSVLSVPLQNTLRSSLTVYAISQRDEFLAVIGRTDLVPKGPISRYDPYQVVLEQVLQLDAREFEILVAHLLTALGFEGSEVTGKTGDGGVDARGELNIANMAKVKIFVQAKRYQLGSKIAANVVKSLRAAIPRDAQGAFITTADFDKKAAGIALDPDFPRIGLINGNQLVDLLIEHWDDIPSEFRDRLGLKQGLVLA